MPQKLMTQKEFADKLRAELPELKDFNDSQIVGKVLERRPELTDKIENPMSGDVAASNAQARAERGSRSLMNPEVWDKHPRMKQFTQSVMNALPGAGGILGGLAATPETMGTGTLFGSALGAGIGRGAMDIGNQMLGIEDTSPMEKARNIGMDTAIAATAPGVMTAARYPINSVRATLAHLENNFMPKGLRPYMEMPWMRKFIEGGNKIDPLTRPPNMPTNVPKITPEESPINTSRLSKIFGEEHGPLFRQSAEPAIEQQGRLPLGSGSKLRVRLDANGKFIDMNTGEEVGPLAYQNEFEPWAGAKKIGDAVNKLMPEGRVFPSFKGKK